MTKAIFMGLAICAVTSGAQIPVPPPPPTPVEAPTPQIPAEPPVPMTARPLLALPELPDLPDLPDMPDLPEMPDMPDMPDMPVIADFDFDSRFHFDLDALEFQLHDLASIAPKALNAASRALARVQGQSPFEQQFGTIATDPPQAWAQSDPADSLYRLARETLNRGEYRRAAQLFNDISQRFPNSAYAADARYWRAFALYRIGSTSDLRDALRALEGAGPSYRQASLQADAAELTARIRGALAVQGDRTSAAMVSRTAASSGDPCDREDLAVRIEALNSLGKMDPESTTPILRRVLARRDDCSTSLRRAALYLLGKRKDPEAMSLVMTAARNDTDVKVRSDALRFLAAMPGDQAIGTIEEIARTPGNEPLQRAAISALGRSDSPRARQSLRAIVERTDLSESLRASALSSLDDCECGQKTDNGAYLRSIYPRLETPRLKSYALRAIAKSGGAENEQWLLAVVRNQSEPVEVRASALRYAGVSSISIADLARMYDVAGDRPLRVQLIQLYAQRPSPEATDKLLEIAKKGTDPDMRRMAISALSRKNDPRTKQLLLEIIDK